VEVLRGPQGTLFGKNSIAGAMNLTTAKPTDEVEVSLKALYEFESAQQEYNVVLSGPLADNFRARLAWRGYEEEGYVVNTFKNTDEPQRDENAVRLTLAWDVNPYLEAILKIENSSYDTVGRQIEIVRDEPNRFPAGATPIAGLNLAQILGAFGQPSLESNLDYKRQVNAGEFSNTDLDNITLTLNYDMGTATFTSVTSQLEYDFDERCDCDFVPANIFEVRLGESFEQFSQEVRLASDTDGAFDWMVGGYYQSTDMYTEEGLDVQPTSFIGTLARTSPDPQQQALVAVLNTSALRRNTQDTDAWALFFQGTWDIADALHLTAGGRYTSEDKTGARNFNLYTLGSANTVTNPSIPIVYWAAFKMYSEQLKGLTPAPGVIPPLPGHNVAGSRTENQFTPLVTLQWDFSDSTMLYASMTRGYKAGGFDARANNPFSFEFGEETATSWEFGSKSRLLDGAVELNTALFFTDYDNLQIGQFDGALGINVGNVKNTEIMGLELDGRWAATENLVVGFAYSWLDFEYTDFNNGNCWSRQVPDGAVVNGIPLCNFTGMTGNYAPKNSLSLTFDHEYPLAGDMRLVSSLMINYRASQNIHTNLDPLYNIASNTRTNLRIGLEGDRWQVGFIGKNLTDKAVLTYAANVPLSSSIFGTNTFYAFTDRGRQLALEAGYRF
jgi:iron complex outermembrane receptor protein